MINYSSYMSIKKTPAIEPIPGSNQIPNSGGGYSFPVDKWKQFHRFLILGSEGGSYYASERKLTQENAKNVIECIKEDGIKVVNHLVFVSVTGAAPKNDQAIFTLALACTYGDQKTKELAYSVIKDICRIGTHIFQFCQMIQDLRGWSRGLRKGVSQFYLSSNEDKIAYQLIKYRQRNGWTHRDVLRLSHPKSNNSVMNCLFKYAVGKKTEDIHAYLHPLIGAFEQIQNTTDIKKAAMLIREYQIPRECVPTQLLNSKEIWDALLQSMPITAMIRNLGKMTQVGLISNNFDESVKLILLKILDLNLLKKSKVHPLSILTALKVYEQGQGEKGSLSWSPVSRIVAGLQDAFYLSFGAVEPTGKNWLLGLDVSGSMTGARISGSPLDAKTASAAMAMLLVRTEPHHEVMAFCHCFVKLNLTKHDSLDSVIHKISGLPFGNTDCSLPMIHAIRNKMPIDIFAVYTDSETNTGMMHPVQALREHRRITGRDSKLAVVAMCANSFSIADPSDAGMLDVVGFDLATPQVMADFAKGQI